MAETHIENHDVEDAGNPTGEELANRLFALVMAGVLAVILAMTVIGDF